MSASSHVQTNDGNGVSSAANGEGGSAFGLVESGSYVGKDENGKKIFIPLENNPEILNPLAHRLGLNPNLEFHDLYSFTEPDLIALVPRPALALLFMYPETDEVQKWHAEDVHRQRSEAEARPKAGEMSKEPLWFRQDVTHCCGLMGTIHCTLNASESLTSMLDSQGPFSKQSGSTHSSKIFQPNSILHRLQQQALTTPSQSAADINTRADLISQSTEIEEAYTPAALQGSTKAPALGEEPGHAFIAFVKDDDGDLWEMDGARPGARWCGKIGKDDDLLSEKALALGPLPYLEREAMWAIGRAPESDDAAEAVRTAKAIKAAEFSCTVLAPVP